MTNGLSIGNTKANRLLDVSIVPDTQQLGVLTNYTVYFTTATFLGKGTMIEVEFPKSIFGSLFNTSIMLCNAIQNLEATLSC